MRIRSTRNRNNKYNSHRLLKSPSHNINRIKIYSNILREKSTLFPSLKWKKNRLEHESFYQSNKERLLHLSPEECKNELN